VWLRGFHHSQNGGGPADGVLCPAENLICHKRTQRTQRKFHVEQETPPPPLGPLHEPMKIPAPILRYWLAMNASALQAAVHSAKAFFGVAGAHAAIDGIPALNLQQFAAVFLIAFGTELLSYLDKHPVGDLLPPSE
jgi:hypothetical protein